MDKAQAKLQKALENEVKHEKDNYHPDDTLKGFLDEKGFKLIEQENDTQCELVKTVGQYKISIVFQSRAPQQQQQEEDTSAQPQGQQQDQTQESQNDLQDYCDFITYIESKSKALVFEMSSYDSELSIHGVSIATNVNEHKIQNKFQKITTEYQGPDFQSLDERLQISLQEYLKSFGIDEEIGAFIEHVSLDKEQRLYMRWLENMKQYLQ